MAQAAPAKHWCFTLNNPAPDEVKPGPEYDYMVIGKEVGAEGTHHLQGYIALKSKARMTALKKWLPRAHFEVCKGTPEQNRAYCIKDGDYHEDGVLPAPAQKAGGDKRKAQYQEAYELAKQGRRDEIDPEFLIRYDGALRRIEEEHRVCPETLDDQFTAVWIWGGPGVGKSRKARDDYGSSLYVKNCNKWFDGYKDEDHVLIEDVDPDTVAHSANKYKLWFDRYPIPVEVKGGSKMIRPKLFIVTSNYEIEECFKDPRDAAAIRRRCKVIHMQ